MELNRLAAAAQQVRDRRRQLHVVLEPGSSSENLGGHQKWRGKIGRQPLDARGRVNGVTDNRVFEPLLVAEGACDDVAEMDANPDLHRRQSVGKGREP